jgi:hypothetical protein
MLSRRLDAVDVADAARHMADGRPRAVLEEPRASSGGHDSPVAKDIPGHPGLIRERARSHHDARESRPEKALELGG